MNCREFRSKHVGFTDDLLPIVEMRAMQAHLAACARCATLDVRIRRSLLVMRNLPQIEPSVDFYARLSRQLREAPPLPERQPMASASTFMVLTAALAAAVYFAMAGSARHLPVTEPGGENTASLFSAARPAPISEAAMMASVPTGVPVWPAMFMVSELPMRLTTADLQGQALGR